MRPGDDVDADQLADPLRRSGAGVGGCFDGRYVAASKGETRLGAVKLWLGHIDGGSGSVLTPEPDQLKTTGAAFTPDGRYIWHARRMNSWDYNAAFPQYQLAVYEAHRADISRGGA